MMLEMSIHASLLIVLILLLRTTCWLPKRLFVVLWDIVLARLLIPGMILVPMSFYLLPAAPADMSAMAGHEAASFPWMWIWLAGLSVTAVLMICLYVREYRILRESLPPTAAESVKIQRCLHGRSALVRVSDRIQTPVAFGLWKPKIILPKTFMTWSDEACAYALCHEIVHLRRLDNLQKVVMIAAICVHWYNPLVWVMHRMLDRDIERACDEKVIAMFGEDSRSSYANVLLDLASKQHYWSVYGNGFGRSAIHERIHSMMKHKKITIVAIIATVVVVAVAATAFAQADPQPAADFAPTTDSVKMKSTAIAEDSGKAVVYDEDGAKVTEAEYEFDLSKGKVILDGKEIEIMDISADPNSPLQISVKGAPEEDGFKVKATVTSPEGTDVYEITDAE